MTVDTFRVDQPGMLTTIQDLGRWGYQRLGVPVAGAMDAYSLRVGNLLVGNGEGEVALEGTFMGPTLDVLADAVIAVTGADLSATLNEIPLPLWESVFISKGDTIALQGPRNGVRAYLCISGGFDIPVVMDSKSTYLPAQIGGYHGRALQHGDVLKADLPDNMPSIGLHLPDDLIPIYGGEVILRVVIGPQEDHFTQNGIQTFLSSEYVVSPQMDRMGVRLEGPQIEHSKTADIVSDGIMLGSVQVPGDKQPIVMMADRQTTGGYAKIATVISVDIPKLAHAQPGDTVRFTSVTVDEAHAAFKEQEERLGGALFAAEPGTVANVQREDGKKRHPGTIPVDTEQEAVEAEYQGRRYSIALKDGLYELIVSGKAKERRGRRYRIVVAGIPYEVIVR